MQPPIRLKLLLWYYNRFLKVDHRKLSASEMRLAVNGSSAKAKKFINGPNIPVFRIENRTIPTRDGDIPIRIYFPNEEKDLPVITYYHGGGFVIYGLDSHDHICRRICRDNNAVVVSVDYRLAPEHKFPAAVYDCYDALLWVSENLAALNGDAEKLIVLGDSAGGNLAATVCHLSRDLKGPKLAAQVLVYPTVDARMEHASITENGDGYILTADLMYWFLDHYKSKDEDMLNPMMSPLLAKDFSNLPPALVIVAGLDPLRDEGKAYAEKLKSGGNHVQLTVYEGLTHSFFSMPGLLKRCVAAYEEIKFFLAEKLE